jgi:hypothetical protein
MITMWYLQSHRTWDRFCHSCRGSPSSPLGPSRRASLCRLMIRGTPDRSKLFGSHGQRPWLHDVVRRSDGGGGRCRSGGSAPGAGCATGPEGRVFQERMGRWRREVQPALRDGSRRGSVPTAATCFEILKVEEGPWTFPRVPGVEPTRHAVERALRHAVIGRRIRGGTDRVPGSRFGERMPSVVATCRQQGRNVLEDQTSCFEADRRGQALPALVPAQTPDIKVA